MATVARLRFHPARGNKRTSQTRFDGTTGGAEFESRMEERRRAETEDE